MKKLVVLLGIGILVSLFGFMQGYSSFFSAPSSSINQGSSKTIPVSGSYSNAEDFLKAEGDICKVATDGCNTVQIINGQLGGMTQMWCEDVYGPNGKEQWSCREYLKTTQPNPADQVACTAEYDPVCAQPPMPPCPEGLSCAQVMPPLQTYGNSCQAGLAGAEIMYQGECRGDNISNPNPGRVCRQDSRICPDGSTVERTGPNCEFAACPAYRPIDQVSCPDIYLPVCGIDGNTYGNRCEAGNIRIAHSGTCESLINRDRIQRLNNRYENRFKTLINQAPRENIHTALERIDLLIENTRKSRMSSQAQQSRITSLVFFRNLFEEAAGR